MLRFGRVWWRRSGGKKRATMGKFRGSFRGAAAVRVSADHDISLQSQTSLINFN